MLSQQINYDIYHVGDWIYIEVQIEINHVIQHPKNKSCFLDPEFWILVFCPKETKKVVVYFDSVCVLC